VHSAQAPLKEVGKAGSGSEVVVDVKTDGEGGTGERCGEDASKAGEVDVIRATWGIAVEVDEEGW
tara:strand:- start:377 stop:571 length:195 start_codon:yes stop_codon:yes gene_type:complete